MPKPNEDLWLRIEPNLQIPLVFYKGPSEDSALMQARQHLQALADLISGFKATIITKELIVKDSVGQMETGRR